MNPVHNALVTLRSAVAGFDEDKKLALAAFLALECTVHVSFPVFQQKEGFSQDLVEAFEASTKFSRAAKLGFAIDLLGFCRDEEGATDGIDSEDDYDLDPYGYDTPAPDEEEEDY